MPNTGDRLDLPDRAPPIEGESGIVAFDALLRPFARGALLVVSPTLDFFDVARAIRDDDADRVQTWMERGLLARASDEQAAAWQAGGHRFVAIVLAPWVLVQVLESSH